MGYEVMIGYIVQGLCTGFGVAIGTWIYKKYMEPSLEKGHDKLAKVQVPAKFPEPPETLVTLMPKPEQRDDPNKDPNKDQHKNKDYIRY
jgi:hypothetical protein